MHQYRHHAQLMRSINVVLKPLVPDATWSQLRIACVHGACLHVLVEHSVMLMQLRGVQHLLLKSVQTVHAGIRTIDFKVRPKARAYVTPDRAYSAQKNLAEKRTLSDHACKQLASLCRRCQNPALKNKLEMMLKRYSASTE